MPASLCAVLVEIDTLHRGGRSMRNAGPNFGSSRMRLLVSVSVAATWCRGRSRRRNGEAHRTDTGTILARVEEVEEHFRDVEIAGSGFAELNERRRVDPAEREGLIDLERAVIGLEEPAFQVQQVGGQALAGEQSRLLRVPALVESSGVVSSLRSNR